MHIDGNLISDIGFLHCGGPGTLEVVEVKGHADDASLRRGQVREDARETNLPIKPLISVVTA